MEQYTEPKNRGISVNIVNRLWAGRPGFDSLQE